MARRKGGRGPGPGERVECGRCGAVEYLAPGEDARGWRERHDAEEHPRQQEPAAAPRPVAAKASSGDALADPGLRSVRCPQCGAPPWAPCVPLGISHGARLLALGESA